MLITLTLLAIVTAFIFTFLNGMNDATNCVSTVLATRVFTPRQAIIWAAFWEFVAFFLCKYIFGFTVAMTMGNGIAVQSSMDPQVILSALIGAAIWVFICNKVGMPISTSHALIGGIIGAVWFVHGSGDLIANGIIVTLSFILLSPIIGFIFGFFLLCLFIRIFKNSKRVKVEKTFKKMQYLSSAAFCIGHGANDAQKTLGIIAALMLSALTNPEISGSAKAFLSAFYDVGKGFYIPDVIGVICYLIMSLGVVVGGQKVMKTLGSGLVKIDSVKGFSAEFAAAVTLIGTSIAGIPVSTTHTLTGALIGVGITDGVKSVKWATARHIVLAWVFTVPATLIIAGIVNKILSMML